MYPQHIQVFTDGSKQSNHTVHTANAVVLNSQYYRMISQFSFCIHYWNVCHTSSS